jgi:hypothetical protein
LKFIFKAAANGAALQNRDFKSDLLNRFLSLEERAKAMISKLTVNGRARELAYLKEERRLQELTSELKAAYLQSDFFRIRNLLGVLENSIGDELKRLEREGITKTLTSTTCNPDHCQSFIRQKTHFWLKP